MAREVVLTPGVLLLLAVLSVGGLMFLGWQASLVGNATAWPYEACCTVETWRHSSTGFKQGEAITTTETCRAHESPGSCCLRNAGEKIEYPVRLLGAMAGRCEALPPELNYPVSVPSHQAGSRQGPV